MEPSSSIWSIILLFVLRLGVPIMITLGIGYFLKRLDARWQAEARQEREARDTVRHQPATAPKAASQRPLAPSTMLNASGAMPCWMVKGCTDAVQAACAAPHQPNVSCWQARQSAEGRLPAECKGCELYVPTSYVLTESRVLH